MKQMQKYTNFHLSLILMLKNPVVFFSCGVKIPYQQLLIFLNFITELQYERITRSYYSSMVS